MVATIKFSEMTDGGDLANNEKTPGLLLGENVLFNNPWTFLPPGTTVNRPTPSSLINYRLRFNTDDKLYEYYDADLSVWTQLQESAFTVGPFITYTADATLPDAQNLGILDDGILKQTISSGIATLDIAVNAVDYWAPGDALTRTQVPTIGDDVTNKTYVDGIAGGLLQSVIGTLNQIDVGISDPQNPILSLSSTLVAPGTVAIGSSATPPGLIEVTNTSSGTVTEGLRLTNRVASGVNTGISLVFQPNNASSRGASIVSVQTTAGNHADLEFYTAGGGTPALAMTITNGQQVLIGSPTFVGSSQFQVSGEGTGGNILIGSFVNSVVGSGLRIAKSRSAVAGVSVTVQNGDDLGRIGFFGDDGASATNFPEGARIETYVSGAVSAGIVPCTMLFATTNTSGSLQNAMTISDAQVVSLVNALAETSGGTHQSTYTLGDILYSSAANTLSKLAGNITSGIKYLSQTGTGAVSAAPVWATISGGDITGAALTKTDDTNVTLTLGGTPTTALLRAASLTLGWTGTLSGTRGGTGVNNGASTITLGGSLTTSGAFASTFTMTNTTSVTFPTSGTLATTSQLATPAALTKTDDTNVTLTLGGTPATALLQATSLTLGWTGQLGLTRGGTAASLTASNGGIIYSTASALAVLAGTATAGQMLQSGASTTPAWSTSTYPATNAINTLLYASSANVMSALATANSSVLVTSSGGVPSLSTALPSGLTATNMNLTTPTIGVAAATSINFGGTALSAYTEGTWTPIDSSGASLTFTSVVARYTRIGRLVIAQATLTYPVTADGTQNVIGGLPFTVANNNGSLGGSIGFTSVATASSTQPLVNTTTCRLYRGNSPMTNAELSAGTFYITQIYTV